MIKDFDKLIDKIIELPIQDVIEKYTGKTLRKKGGNYTMPCPFCGGGKSTPCFFVNERKNICKCYTCQTGADSLSFVKKYLNVSTWDAVTRVAQDFGISYEIEQQPRTPEQEELHKKREAALILMENTVKFYASQLAANEQKTDYVKKRWGDSNLNTTLFGYASDAWDALLNHASANAWNLELMQELGLLTKNSRGQLRDTFRDRIMIPVQDRRGRTIAFTARNVGPETYTKTVDGVEKGVSIAKYINSSESFLFTKGEHLFGLSVMKRSRCERNRIYLVEGAADVLAINNIRVYNVAAPMGTALTDAQLDLLKREGISEICFIPDQDEIKPGEKDGAGMKNAIKNAQRCIKKGFSVTIKIIPSKDNKKEDPGSYFTDKSKFTETKEEDFILYYAYRVYDDATTVSDKDKAMKEIASLLKDIKEDSIRDAYVTRFSERKMGKVKAWREAIADQAKQQVKDNKNPTGEGRYTTYEKYGFFEEHNCYKAFSDDGSGRAAQWSNFTMKPLFHIKDSTTPKRMYEIKNCFGYREIIEMKQEELTSMSKFKTKTEGCGNFIWEAGERELIKLKKYLYEETKTAIEVKQLGWQKGEGVYAFGNGIYDGKDFKTIDNYGIVTIEKPKGLNSNYYLPAFSDIYRHEATLYQFERRFVHTTYADVTLYDYANKMIGVFGENAKVGLIFLFATLFKDVIITVTKSFPILNLFGPKGAGKSEMGHSLMSFFVKGNKPENITNSTKAALADSVGQVSNALVHLDEFKNSIDLDKREFLKGLWDNVGRSRMNMDKDKKREMTDVDCGVIVSGQEMATADIALFSRFVYLCFPQTKYSDEEKDRFDKLKGIEKEGLSHLTLEILQFRGLMIAEYHNNYNLCIKELNEELKNRQVRIDDRIYRNWLTLLAAFRTLHARLSLPFHYNEIRELMVDLMIRQNKECASNNELAEFWEIVTFLNQRREIYIDAEFRITHERSLKLNNGTTVETINEKNYLYLNKRTIFPLYQKMASSMTEKPLAKNSLIYYLSTSPEYIGEKNTVRFKNIIRGMEEKKNSSDGLKSTTMMAQAMIFDYDMIKKHYDIDLNVYDDVDIDNEPSGPAQPEAIPELITKDIPF
ncbi:CHC2 zinc finger domain-containing protein [Parabacteroides goldsteinii]|uniref:CHC2 zinc finger domain-containing protein n=1 Tax=Parabacteroides goldsteinii TaxID=328812 RepID=UPI002676C2EC|nr:CHC2 zinc finger domain-containing protein [Parabacteroides goldsteinii]